MAVLMSSPKRVLVLLGACALIASASTSPTRAAANYQHSVYPGSDDAAHQQARAKRNAPNMYCEKHENDCE